MHQARRERGVLPAFRGFFGTSASILPAIFCLRVTTLQLGAHSADIHIHYPNDYRIPDQFFESMIEDGTEGTKWNTEFISATAMRYQIAESSQTYLRIAKSTLRACVFRASPAPCLIGARCCCPGSEAPAWLGYSLLSMPIRSIASSQVSRRGPYCLNFRMEL